jgi:SecD/SecF fusion protein
MSNPTRWRLCLVVFFILLSCFYLAPTLIAQLPSWWKGALPQEKINLGLDLQGGSHLVLEVQTQAALESYLERAATQIEEALQAGDTPVKRVARDGAARLRIVLYDPAAADVVEKLVREKFPDLEISPPTASEGLISLDLQIGKLAVQEIESRAVAQALETIRNRVDELGLAEPLIQREGENHIVVQLPGIKDPQRAIELIGMTALLEFKLVDESVDTGVDPADLPEDVQILKEKRTDPVSGRVAEIPLAVKKRAILTGDLLNDAQVRMDPQFNQPYVAIEFNPAGARLFDRITAANVGKRFAIVLDNTVYSAPVIRERISGGMAQISGSFTEKEAADLAIVLRAGSLPVPVEIVQNVTVGPSLGQDSIHKGLLAGAVGVILVVGFMLVYYRFAGLVANVGMVLNIAYLMAALAALGATLTLPGIAAIVLLIGMSVDSNVLIFERIKEELRLGKSPGASLHAGYEKAFLTIMDSHVTTLITAAVLFQFGTGPVKGFAVSLSLGILINLFTSLVATRVFFNLVLNRFGLRQASFGRLGTSLFQRLNLDFIGKRRIAFILSGIIAVIGLIGIIQISRNAANMGIDFSGGTAVQLKFSQPPSMESARAILAGQGFKEASLQEIREGNKLLIKIGQSGDQQTSVVEKIRSSFAKEMPGNSFEVESSTEIGPSIGDKLKKDTLVAVAISMLGIVCYVGWRFDLKFGIGALVATLHDVLAMFALFYIMGKEINLLFITAVLTIAGYSLTDTVVIFDRTRENLRKNLQELVEAIFNRSLNEVLSRTIITSVTTFLAAFALFLFGGEVIHDFAFALTAGVIIATYSSIFVASPAVVQMYLRAPGKIPKEAEPGAQGNP